MKIGVFCSASDHQQAEVTRVTEELGSWMARRGHTLVYGGVSSGLMECLACAVKAGGGRTIGVVPEKLLREGRVSGYVDIEIGCADLSDRKQLIIDQSDAFVVLPGGIGTLDEMFCVAASATIGFHRKPLVVYNICNFWNPLINLLDTLARQGMVRGEWRRHVGVATTLDELTGLLSAT